MQELSSHVFQNKQCLSWKNLLHEQDITSWFSVEEQRKEYDKANFLNSLPWKAFKLYPFPTSRLNKKEHISPL